MITLYKPRTIYLPHLDPEDNDFMTTSVDTLASKSSRPGFVNVKFSDVRNDGEDFLIIDAIVPLLRRHIISNIPI